MPTISISLSGTTGLNILAYRHTGRWRRFLSSIDLMSWVPIATNRIAGGGTASFSDTWSLVWLRSFIDRDAVMANLNDTRPGVSRRLF